MERKIEFSQLWVEEEQCLRDQASLLGENSVIVEIGTAQGGSAYLFTTFLKAGGVSIYSYDISPSAEAYENLKGLEINIIAKSSVKGAREWPKKYGKMVDLLFIDGSHTLENVYLDFISWLLYVKPGGRILFHDFDPLHRAGSAHLGVKVFIDALLKLDIFSDVKHVGRIFAGIKKKEVTHSQLIEGCVLAWKDIGKKLEKFKEFDFCRCNFIGDNQDYLTVLKELRSLGARKIEDLNELSGSNNVLVLPEPLSEDITDRISEKSNFIFLDELIFFYLLYDSMLNNRNKVLEITQNRRIYFKWEELLEMHNHAHNCEGTIESIFNIKNNNIRSLSRVCARELVRVNMLKNIFLAINGKL